jgi:ABC-type phosphate/phosphonate transport system ATPase subunit
MARNVCIVATRIFFIAFWGILISQHVIVILQIISASSGETGIFSVHTVASVRKLQNIMINISDFKLKNVH